MSTPVPAPSRRWHGIELRHLRALVAIGETGSFSEAAIRLGYVQSTVSYHVLALEQAVGLTLVHRRRGARAVSLTPAGKTLARHAQRVLSELGLAENELSGAAARPVAVALEIDVARLLLPSLHRIAAEGGFAVEATEIMSGDAGSVLARGTCTVAVVEPLEDVRLCSRPILRDRFVFVEPATGSNRAIPVGRSELGRATFVVHRRREARLLRALDLLGIDARSGLTADTDAATLELVGAGLGKALVPELALQDGRPGLHVRELAAEIALPPRVVALAWTRGRELERAEEELLTGLLRPAR